MPLAAEEEAQWAAVADGPRFGAPQLVRPRLGQGTFRVAVTQAYHGACAVSGEHSLPVLDVAHIRGYAEGGPHDVRNGLLLRADIHRLFDRGYVTVTPDHPVRGEPAASRGVREREDLLRAPRERDPSPGPRGRPSGPALLRWHNEQVFERGAA